MFIIDAIDPMIFFISLAVGLFFGYVTARTPRIVFKYPTPYNSDKIVYTDTVGNCYKYKATETKCPNDSKKITPVIFD